MVFFRTNDVGGRSKFILDGGNSLLDMEYAPKVEAETALLRSPAQHLRSCLETYCEH